MSHFAVAVVTPSKPSATDIANALAPFQEAGARCDEGFIEDVDVTEEARRIYTTSTRLMIRLADGSLKSTYDEAFWVEPSPEQLAALEQESGFDQDCGVIDGTEYRFDYRGDGARCFRLKRLPEGSEQVTLTYSEIMDFRAFVEFYYESPVVPLDAETDEVREGSYAIVGSDGEIVAVIDRTNPNGYWDWYEVGGRWQGELRAVDRAEAAVGTAPYGRDATSKGYDIVRRGNLDIAEMKAARAEERRRWLNEIAERAKAPYSELEFLIRSSEKAHEAWLQLPEPRPRGAEYGTWMSDNFEDGARLARVRMASFHTPELKEGQTLEDYIQDAVPLSVSAIVKDGRWIDNGKVGWFGTKAAGAMSDEEWKHETWRMIEALPEDHWITIVDCHI